MCFLETYRKALERAVERRQAPRWMVTLGTDLDRRKMELDGAIRRGMISRDHAQSLLPPPQQQDGGVAGLLKHEGAGGFLPQDSVAKKEVIACMIGRLITLGFLKRRNVATQGDCLGCFAKIPKKQKS